MSTADIDICPKQLDGWMTNNKLRLNANKTDFIIIGTSRKRSKRFRFFPTNILTNNVCNQGVTLDIEFNFRTLFRIIRYMFLFQSPKPLKHDPLIVGLITATRFFKTLYSEIFYTFSVFRTA